MYQIFFRKCLVILLAMAMIGTSTAAYGGSVWRPASATFYGDETASATMGGACGYGNLWDSGYGAATVALSTTLFNGGYSCGQCFQIRCVSSPNCYYGSPAVVVTATNICPPNWGQDSNNGGWCNPPRAHFDFAKPAFMKMANWKAGIVPVSYRRVACRRKGGIRFKFEGNGYWLLVYVMNVGGAGDIKTMAVKGSRTKWLPMSHNWGASYQSFSSLYGQSLSFRVTSYTTQQTLYAWNAAPASWTAGKTYMAKVNFS